MSFLDLIKSNVFLSDGATGTFLQSRRSEEQRAERKEHSERVGRLGMEKKKNNNQTDYEKQDNNENTIKQTENTK